MRFSAHCQQQLYVVPTVIAFQVGPAALPRPGSAGSEGPKNIMEEFQARGHVNIAYRICYLLGMFRHVLVGGSLCLLCLSLRVTLA